MSSTPRVFISGPMGSGKSSVAARLAERWGVPLVDLDQRIERTAGASVAEVFAQRGEPGFRDLEREVLAEVLADPQARVVALGGGAVCDPDSRRALLSAGTLVTLWAAVGELARRVGSGRSRPLLAGQDVAGRLGRLAVERGPAYAECHAWIDTAGLSVDAVVGRVEAAVRDRPVVVPLGERTYRVEIGQGVRARLAERATTAARGEHVVVVTDEGVDAPWGEQAREALQASGRRAVPVCLPQGEAHKHIRSVERIWDAALEAGLDRQGLVVAVGGGVVGDMAAFAASTLLRGVAFGQLPTTLLAMVDSAVGGKTGFDRPQGKNLVGTFHQPRFVLCDVDVLQTLPQAERRAGLAEVVKSAWLDSEASVQFLEAHADALASGDAEATTEAVRMSVRLKAGVVTRDETEAGERALLNLGHTVGHAIEAAEGYRGLRHGEAVALGMVAAFRVARGVGALTGDDAERRLTGLLTRLGLPTELDAYLRPEVLAFVGSDKKRAGGKVKFVVPGAPGETGLQPLSTEELSRLLGVA